MSAPPASPPGSFPSEPSRYSIGVMSMEVEGGRGAGHDDQFSKRVAAATGRFERAVAGAVGVSVKTLAFRGPHLTPADGGYAPLDFLRIGMTEKLERGVQFLLIVTEVDLAATALSYVVALPSRLTNVAVVSTKRLDPEFWGDDPDEGRLAGDLSTLLMHCFGHLLNLPHHPDAGNVMFDFAGVDDLPAMTALTDAQRQTMRRNLPREAHERTSRGRHGLFILRMLAANAGGIVAAAGRANPIRLLARLPTMVTTALSVLLVLFFSPEPWDVGSTVALYQLALFGAVAVGGATAVLYRAFSFGARAGRGRTLAESTVVTAAATLLSLTATVALLFLLFAGLTWAAAATVFPEKLMETWPTVDPAVRTTDHVKLSLFVAGVATLAGSLGGRADSRDLVRGVLFVDEET